MVGRCNGPRSAWRPWGTSGIGGIARGDVRRPPLGAAAGCRDRSGGLRGVVRHARSGRSTTFTDGSRWEFLCAAAPSPSRHRPARGSMRDGRPVGLSRARPGGSASAALAGCRASARRLRRQPRPRTNLAQASWLRRYVSASYAALRSSAARRGRGGRSRRSPRRPFGSRAASPFGALDHADDVRRRPRRPNPRPFRGDDDEDAKGEQRDPRPAHIRFYATGRVTAARAASTRGRAAQPSRWSLTRPIACMNA